MSNISELGCFDYLVYQLHHSSKADIWTIDLSFPSLWLSFLSSLKKPIRLRLCSYSRRRTVNFGFQILVGIGVFFHEVVTLPAWKKHVFPIFIPLLDILFAWTFAAKSVDPGSPLVQTAHTAMKSWPPHVHLSEPDEPKMSVSCLETPIPIPCKPLWWQVFQAHVCHEPSMSDIVIINMSVFKESLCRDCFAINVRDDNSVYLWVLSVSPVYLVTLNPPSWINNSIVMFIIYGYLYGFLGLSIWVSMDNLWTIYG